MSISMSRLLPLLVASACLACGGDDGSSAPSATATGGATSGPGSATATEVPATESAATESAATESAATEVAATEVAADAAAMPALTPALAAAGVTEADLLGPHDPPADAFHPDRDEPVEPALGGRAIMHLANEPPNLNKAIDNTGAIRWIYFDIHAGLVQFSPVTFEQELDLATGYDIEDTLILAGGRTEDNGNILFGKVTEEGDDYVVTSGSSFNDIVRTVVPKADVEALERGTVYTFTLRDDALWHDGHAFDAEDVLFSWSIYANEHVDCDEVRFKFSKILEAEILEPYVVRFFWDEQYFATTDAFGLDFCVLPRHRFDLSDPDNADYEPDATDERRGEYINDNPANTLWVGLGPYKVTRWERGQFIEADKFDGYWKKDPADSGYLDQLRWRYISNDDSAFQALLNGDVDIFYRVKSEDFFGELTQSDVFNEDFYKAFTYVGNLGYTSWNLYRTKFQDVRVRKALAQAFDVENWITTNYKGYALWTTSSMFRFGPGYNNDVVGYPYDVESALDLLTEAGWYDRDGNGIIDKDGEDFVIEVLMPSGNKASEKFLQGLQDAYSKVGIKVEIQAYEWGTFLEKILERDFDACNLAWVLTDVESDPFQIWHSEEAQFDKRSSNHAGLADPEVDRLIELGRRELDEEKRSQIWHDLHARIYELQPYLFGWNVPRKLAINTKLRGVKLYKFDPGFRLQDIYYEAGTPGTRPLAPVR